MVETPRRILCTEDLRPAYYDDFHCLMGNCRASCCTGCWRITFDRKDYLKIKKQKGTPELNARLEHCLRRIRKKDVPETWYAEFATGGVACPLLDENGLCSLQLEKGANALPQVCRVFPRQECALYSGYWERSLSPACEGVLALLWDLPDGVSFRSDPLPVEKQVSGTYPENSPLAESFQDIRSLCIDFLQDRRRPLPHRILLLGLALRELADGGTQVPHFLERGRLILEQGDAGELLRELDDSQALEQALFNNVRLLLSLGHDGNMKPALKCLAQWLSLESRGNHFRINRGAYLAARERYEERFAGRAYFMENLMVSLFFHKGLPNVNSPEALWKSYVNFCNLYAAYRFMAVMSCREGASGDRDELFRLLVTISRVLLHNTMRQNSLRDEFFQNDSATLAHMAILVCGA